MGSVGVPEGGGSMNLTRTTLTTISNDNESNTHQERIIEQWTVLGSATSARKSCGCLASSRQMILRVQVEKKGGGGGGGGGDSDG